MKRNEIAAFEMLKNLIITKYNGKSAAGGREVTKRCHYCGDSRNLSSRHMYIGVNKNTGLINYNCFKCGAHGIVGSDFFRDIGEFDDQITIEAVLEHNKKSHSIYSTPSNSIIQNRFKPIINYNYDETIEKKLAYINKRLGLTLDINDLKRLKIILNLNEYLQANKVNGITRSQDIVNCMSFGFIGFLSIDNCYVTMRRLIKEESVPPGIRHRYTNYNIYNRETNGRFYAIPVVLDMSKHINIHIAEGPFDILGIYRDNQNKYPNSIWIAVCGKGYANCIKTIISNLGLIDFDIHIYPDNDFTDDECLRIFNLIRFINCGFYIHRNLMPGEKDFGVPREQIKEYIKVIRQI